MENDNWGAAEPLRQAIHDLVSKFTVHIGAPVPSEHDKAVSDMNKQAMDKSVQDANASHAAAMSAQQAAEIRKKAAK